MGQKSSSASRPATTSATVVLISSSSSTTSTSTKSQSWIPPTTPVAPPPDHESFFCAPYSNLRNNNKLYVHTLTCEPIQRTFNFNAKEEELENSDTDSSLNLSLEFSWNGCYTFDDNGEIDFHVKMFESIWNGVLKTRIEMTSEVKEYQDMTVDPIDKLLAAFGLSTPLVKIICSYERPFLHWYAPMGSLNFIGKMMGNDFFLRFAIPSEESSGYRRFCGETLSRIN